MAGRFHERELSGSDDSLSADLVGAEHDGKEVSVSTAVAARLIICGFSSFVGHRRPQ
jgi:hypothetical protein